MASIDSGPTGSPVYEECGAPGAVIDAPITLEIDTRAMRNDQNALCGAVGLPSGPDVYVPLRVQAGELWHVHLGARSADSLPKLAVLGSDCAASSCVARSDQCFGGGDEHVSFVAAESGIRWIVVDDGAAAGGEYTLGFFRPTCGNGDPEHGEACDDGNAIAGDGCDPRCRVELRSGDIEREINDSFFDAQALILSDPDERTRIEGALGGPGACTYPDVFAFTIPDTNRLGVVFEDADGNCIPIEAAPARVRLWNAVGDVVLDDAAPSGECALSVSPLPAGEYFLELYLGRETLSEVPYTVRITR